MDWFRHSITFLFKLAQGRAVRSYGLNVARLAGLHREIVQRAAAKSAEFESQVEARHGNHSSSLFARIQAIVGCVVGQETAEALSALRALQSLP